MSNPPSDRQRPKSAAQRASEANRLQQIAVRDRGPQPSDRRTQQPGDKSDSGLENDQRPVGVKRR